MSQVRSVASVGVLLLVATIGFAAPPQPKLKIAAAKAVAFDRLIGASGKVFAGEPAVYDRPFPVAEGKMLVGVVADLETTWPGRGGRLVVENKEIALVVGGEANLAVGGFASYGVYAGDVPRVWWDHMGNQLTEKRTQNLLFLVPKGTRQAKLKIGTAEASVAIPAAVTKVAPAQTLSVKLNGAKLLSSVDKTGTKEKLTNPAGKLLAVEFTYTPIKANVQQPGKPGEAPKPGFYFNAAHFNLRAGGKVYGAAGTLVHMLGGSKEKHYSLPVNWNYTTPAPATGPKWESRAEEPIFAVPADTKDFELLYLDEVVAKGKVGG